MEVEGLVSAGEDFSLPVERRSSWQRCPISRLILYSQSVHDYPRSESQHTHHRWQGRPSSHVIWLRRQYKQAWFTLRRLGPFFFFPDASWSGSPLCAASK